MGEATAMPAAQFRVPDITCEGCANAIKRALASVSGIETVDVDIEEKIVRVAYDEARTDPRAIRGRIGEAGYDSSEMTEG